VRYQTALQPVARVASEATLHGPDDGPGSAWPRGYIDEASPLKWVGIVLLALVLSGAMLLVAVIGSSRIQGQQAQVALDPFYTPPDPLPSTPGTVIRTEPLNVTVPGGTAHRILYVSERPDGAPAASGGMIFIPDSPVPANGRPVVAWAHGTLGMGDACVPSRSANPLQDTDNWLDQMMSLGWVVVSTDYVGLGTPGPSLYLVAQSEVRDVVNAVRAARNIPQAHAGTRYVTWGHSQGGHSSVWTGHLGREYAPELTLLGVAAAAPALDLTAIMGVQWDTVAGWVIGPSVLESWPTYYPDLPVDGIVSTAGLDAAKRLAFQCIKQSGLEGLARQAIGQDFFEKDPLSESAWAAAAKEQTPAPLPASMPVFIAQGTADEVVLPWPQAIIEDEWCRAGATIDVLWMGGVGHIPAASTAGPSAVAWIANRFAGRPAQRTCDVPPPIAPEAPVR
jgi:pimeloyl-ACP methyl ester carboxylesterase